MASSLKYLTPIAVFHIHKRTIKVNKNSKRLLISYLWESCDSQYGIEGSIKNVEREQKHKKRVPVVPHPCHLLLLVIFPLVILAGV